MIQKILLLLNKNTKYKIQKKKISFFICYELEIQNSPKEVQGLSSFKSLWLPFL